MDDILIRAKNETEHDIILLKVSNKCREVNLKLNKNKIKYKQNNVKYIGHMPPPNNKAELLRFNGFVTYISKFILNLSEIN